MATAMEAIERLAELTGRMPASVGRAARELREEDMTLWPQGAAGHGRAALVEAQHLVNLVMAVSAPDTVTASVRTVRKFGSLAPTGGRRFLRPEQIGIVGALVFPDATAAPELSGHFVSAEGLGCGRDLSSDLAWFIELIANADEATVATLAASNIGFEMSFDSQLPHARISYAEIAGVAPAYYSIHYFPRQPAFWADEDYDPLRRDFVRKTVVRFGLFCALADLWRTTVAARATRSAHAPKKRNAGSPGREPAPIRDRDRTKYDPSNTTSDSSARETGFQRLSSGPGHSPRRSESNDRYDRHRQHSPAGPPP